MGLIEIPPYVRAGDDPPSATTEMRAYHCRAYELVDPIDFPDALFADALIEHARLLEAHSAEILAAPVDATDRSTEADDRFVELEDLHLCSTLLVSDGAAHELHRWRTVDLSFVVWRCRGIVRQLMEVPPEGQTYVVVVAKGTASLQLCRAVPPRRAGDAPRLELVERDRVVEPWDQWHLRAGDFVKTWWRTPLGELVASRVRVRRSPSKARPATDELLTIRGRSLRQRIDAYAREHPDHQPLALLDTSLIGEEIHVSNRREPARLLDPFPAIVEALRGARSELDPVVVYAYRWAALCWLPAAGTSDVAVPPPLIVARTPQPGDEDEDEDDDDGNAAKPATPPRLRLSPEASLLALFDDFPPPDPWAPRVREVNAAWIAGLVLAVYAVLFVFASVDLWYRWFDPFTDRRLGIVVVVVGAAGGLLAFHYFRWQLRQLDPAHRQYRWRAWKQVSDDLKPRTKPAPRVPGRKYWMRRLAERLARLERLAGLDAPELIVENERRLVRTAIAELEKSDADAVLAAWPVAVKHLDPPEIRRPQEVRKARGTDKPN